MNKIITYIISLIIISFAVCFILFPDISFSENEGRNLQMYPEFTFQKLFKGKYIFRLEDYFDDQFPLRDMFMKIRTVVYRGLNIDNIDRVYFGDDEYLIEQSYDCRTCDKLIKTINKFNEKLNGINVDLMLIPDAISIYEEKLPENAISYDQIEGIRYIYNNVDVNTIDVYDTYIENKDKYQLYYKTDHHYTLYGAYFAYIKYCEANNLAYKELSDYEVEVVSEEFSGSLASRVADYRRIYDQIEVINKNIDVSVYYRDSDTTTDSLYDYGYLLRRNKYSFFLSNNRELVVINRNDIKSNSKLLVIKDSYANSMIPFLVDNYSEIHVIDLRFYEDVVSKYIVDNDIDEVLILYSFNIFMLGSINNLK